MPATPTDRLYGLTTSVAVKAPVQISADVNVVAFGEQTITSTTLTGTRTVTTNVGMRVLLTNQTNPIDNGIWVAMPASWVRSPDFDGARDAVNGTLVFTVYGDCWQAEATDPVRIGYDPIHFRSTYPFSPDGNLVQRSLRVPEIFIPEMPPLAQMEGKLVAISGGRPVGVLPGTGTASDVMIELAKPYGASLVGYGSGTVKTALDGINAGNSSIKTDADVEKSAGAFSYFGGQLANFKADMCNPLVQQVNLTLVGDSITWGVGASDVAPSTPRNHSLNDARNNGTSNTWANLLHKYLSREYFAGTPAVESVYPTTIPSGKNVFSYTKVIDLYPGQQGITLTGTWPQVVSASARFGVYFNAAPASGANKLEFALTGNAFSVVFAAEPAGTTYAVYVDNVLLGTYPTSSTAIGVPTSFGNVRKHDIGPFIGSRTIRIEPNGGAGTTLRIEAIRIEKNLQVINQGIIGVETDEYTTNLLSTAVLERSLHVFIQLGTNDRPLVYADKNKANTVMRFKAALEAMIAALPGKNVVLLCANAVSQNESTYPFNMSNVREIIYKVANEKSIDFVDGFSVINSLRGYSYTTDSDGLHPNDLGHNAMYTNLAKALKSASIKK